MDKKRILVVGGVAGGASCAARARRLSEKDVDGSEDDVRELPVRDITYGDYDKEKVYAP